MVCCESDCCQIRVFFYLDTLQWLYCFLVRTIWCSWLWSHLDCVLSPLSNRSFHFVHHIENVNAKRSEFTLKVQTHKLSLASILGQTILQSSRPYIQWDSMMSQWVLHTVKQTTQIQTPQKYLQGNCLILFSLFTSSNVVVKVPSSLSYSTLRIWEPDTH